jgi:hypothetical protein
MQEIHTESGMHLVQRAVFHLPIPPKTNLGIWGLRDSAHSSLIFAASGCRFYCRFWLPFLDAVWQGEITV